MTVEFPRATRPWKRLSRDEQQEIFEAAGKRFTEGGLKVVAARYDVDPGDILEGFSDHLRPELFSRPGGIAEVGPHSSVHPAGGDLYDTSETTEEARVDPKSLPGGLRATMASSQMQGKRSQAVVVDGQELLLTWGPGKDGEQTYALYDKAGNLVAVRPRQYGDGYPTMEFTGEPGDASLRIDLIGERTTRWGARFNELFAVSRPELGRDVERALKDVLGTQNLSAADLNFGNGWRKCRTLVRQLLHHYAEQLTPAEKAALQSVEREADIGASGRNEPLPPWTLEDRLRFPSLDADPTSPLPTQHAPSAQGAPDVSPASPEARRQGPLGALGRLFGPRADREGRGGRD